MLVWVQVGAVASLPREEIGQARGRDLIWNSITWWRRWPWPEAPLASAAKLCIH